MLIGPARTSVGIAESAISPHNAPAMPDFKLLRMGAPLERCLGGGEPRRTTSLFSTRNSTRLFRRRRRGPRSRGDGGARRPGDAIGAGIGIVGGAGSCRRDCRSIVGPVLSPRPFGHHKYGGGSGKSDDWSE